MPLQTGEQGVFLALVMLVNVHEFVECLGEGAEQSSAGSAAAGRFCNSPIAVFMSAITRA